MDTKSIAGILAVIFLSLGLVINVWQFIARMSFLRAQKKNTAYSITFHDYNRLKIKTDRLDMVATLVYFMSMDAIYECRQYTQDKKGMTHEDLLNRGQDINFYHRPSQRLVCTISKNN